MRFALLIPMAVLTLAQAADACSCAEYSDEDERIGARHELTDYFASRATIVLGLIIEPANADKRRAEVIRVVETLVGEHSETIRIWRPFTEDGVVWNSCDGTPELSVEPIVMILMPVVEPDQLARYRGDGFAILPNASAERFFSFATPCDVQDADVEAIVTRARELDRTPD